MPVELREVPPQPLPARPPRQQTYSYSVFDRWTAHPGRKLTPRKLLAAYDMADDGDPIEQCDIFRDRVQADAHLRGIYRQRIQAVALKRWVILPGADGTEDQRAAQLLEERLRLVPNFQRACSHQLRANFYGWGGSEIDWQRVNGLTVPVWFYNVPCRRFRFDEEDRPRLITEDDFEGELLEPGRWWFSTADDEDVIAASGLLRTACWWSMFKSYSVRDWLVWANRYGIPNVHGTYREGAPDEDIEVLKRAVQSLGRDGWAVFSETCKLVITQAQQGGKADDVHGALTTLCDAQLSKLIVGATLLTETSGPGSFALGRVHSDRSFDIVEGDAEQLEHSFEMAVGLPFIHYNGIKARPPRIKFHLVQDRAPETRAKIFALARNEIGIALDADQVRQELQLKKPTGEALEPPAQPAPGPGREE